jgi:hypothetical protein
MATETSDGLRRKRLRSAGRELREPALEGRGDATAPTSGGEWQRRMMRSAIKQKLTPRNRFAQLKSTAVGDMHRRHFVSRQEARKGLDAWAG